MKIFSAAATAAIAAGTARDGGALEIACADPIRVWSGEGSLESDLLRGAGNPFTGLGHRSLVRATAAALGSAAQSITYTLSGIDPEALALIDASEVQRAPVTAWRLIFDASGTVLLDAHIFQRGRVDRLPRSETAGGTATVSLIAEGAARGHGRRSGRMRTDADQRLIDADDGGLSRVSFAGEKTLYWGGSVPRRAGQALG
ncbi:hypothetical protein [Stakelama tenebrarum]|uniref:Uncharacterized protein n=1 Tax=Stakelama tenebrarum TaxID=2711215 RepID=A0A6G6Y5X9_9SPHN|nr:hypothetical protein [Sphingosinithalassobacter tenebrarum]QIG79993.1 hypothetical protein G5C33_09535 [Sphingosinithalassobacter tenebrarum]